MKRVASSHAKFESSIVGEGVIHIKHIKKKCGYCIMEIKIGNSSITIGLFELFIIGLMIVSIFEIIY
jgi:hypothetical protein